MGFLKGSGLKRFKAIVLLLQFTAAKFSSFLFHCPKKLMIKLDRFWVSLGQKVVVFSRKCSTSVAEEHLSWRERLKCVSATSLSFFQGFLKILLFCC